MQDNEPLVAIPRAAVWSARRIRDRCISWVLVAGLFGVLLLYMRCVLHALDAGISPWAPPAFAVGLLTMAVSGNWPLRRSHRKWRENPELQGLPILENRASRPSVGKGRMTPLKRRKESCTQRVCHPLLAMFVHAVAWFSLSQILARNWHWLWGVPTIFALTVSSHFLWRSLYQGLMLFYPRPVLRIGADASLTESAFDLEWELRGSAHWLESLKIYLRAMSYTWNDRECIWQRSGGWREPVRILDLRPFDGPNRGAARVHIPRDARPSIVDRDAVLTWEICVIGDMPFGPSLYATFPIQALPAP